MAEKVLVTGAGGYIGRHVVRALCDRGAEVIGVGRHLSELDPRASVICRDVFDGDPDIFAALGSPDVCIHLAWKDGFIHNSDAHLLAVSDHYRFMRDMIAGGLKQLVVMGTMHEVGYFEGAIDENTPCNPSSMYGIAKDALRRSAILLTKDKDVCLQWLRAYYICGDDKRNHSVFAKIAQAAEEGKTSFPFNTGKNLYDFIDIDVLADQIAAVALQREVDGIINCCTGEPVSLKDKVEAFIRDNGYDIRLDYGAFPDRPYDSPGVWGNPEKIRKIMKGF